MVNKKNNKNNSKSKFKALPPPWKIKVVEPIRMKSKIEREEAIKKAGYNTFLLISDDVFIDLLTDSGTSAMSDNQWAGIMLGDEAYAGSRNFYNLEKAVQEVFGYKYLVPTHQGRGAEHILSQTLIKKGDYIPNNMYFTTRRLHQELAGGTWVDVSIDEAHDPESWFPFKGNIDLKKLEMLIKKVGAARIPYLSVETCVNMAGGQPISIKNLKETKALCDRFEIPIILDATRAMENAYFIKTGEEGFQNKRLGGIVREICSYSIGATVSAKKDILVNIGGFLATNDEELFTKAKEMVVVYEGLHTYGGLAGRDLEAMARGIYESIEEDYMAHRINQVHYLGERLLAARIPIVVPIGGHAVFLDAKQFLAHIPQEQFPAQTLAAALYIESGVRAMERGIVSGEHPGKKYQGLELLRLTIPRRVYTNTHLDYVADAVIELYRKRDKLRGLRMTYEPRHLRFFQARFEPV